MTLSVIPSTSGFNVSITNSIISLDRNRGNGSRAIHELHTDSNGTIHGHRYICPLNHNAEKSLSDRATQIAINLASNEKTQVFNYIVNGGDPLKVEPKNITRKQALQQIVKAAMIMRIDEVIPIAEFISTLSDKQLDSVFNATVRSRVRNKVNKILLLKADIKADTALKEEL